MLARRIRLTLGLFLSVVLGVLAGAQIHQASGVLHPLTWDSEVKEYAVVSNELETTFSFFVTNTAPSNVVINAVRSSCGCTIVKVPSQPWVLPPGTNGELAVKVDLRGKFGLLSKMITVESPAGFKFLNVRVKLPPRPPLGVMNSRTRNQLLALGDRQAVFRNDCVTCHVQPAEGKMGADLYLAACAVCHEAEHRASMVPDLKVLPVQNPTREYWTHWIRSGKPGSLMPAFAKAEGGPLSDEQIASLVDYLVEKPLAERTVAQSSAPPVTAPPLPEGVSRFPSR